MLTLKGRTQPQPGELLGLCHFSSWMNEVMPEYDDVLVICWAYVVPCVGNLDIGDPLTTLVALCDLHKTRGFPEGSRSLNKAMRSLRGLLINVHLKGTSVF